MIGSLSKERLTEYAARYNSAIEGAAALGWHPHSVRRAALRHGIKFSRHGKKYIDNGEQLNSHADYIDSCVSCGQGHKSTSEGLCFSCYAKSRKNA